MPIIGPFPDTIALRMQISTPAASNYKNKRTRKKAKKQPTSPTNSAINHNSSGIFVSLWSLLWSLFALLLIKKEEKQEKLHLLATDDNDDERNDSDVGVQHLCIVGLDCEMVGAGYKGRINMLARCTVVLWNSNKKDTTVIYDKLVKPTQRVMDYRTEFSGITREMLLEQHHHPSGTVQGLVDFQTCRSQVRNLLSSINGKNVLVVGHALVNDFDVLQLSHPSALIRDTATYPPFLRKGNARHQQQKLSYLAKQELGLMIQQNNIDKDSNSRGHCPVEDASAALMLYLKHQLSWEQSLGRPLLRFDPNYLNKNVLSNTRHYCSLSFFLDGCNLPISLRKNKLFDDGSEASWKIITRTKAQQRNTVSANEHDWIPTFRTLLSSSDILIERFVLLFDGSKYKSSNKIAVGSTTMVAGRSFNIEVQITDLNKSADDCLVDTCHRLQEPQQYRPTNATGCKITVDDVLQLLLSQKEDMMYKGTKLRPPGKYYVVVRRRSGSSNRQIKLLFQTCNLTRSSGEGAFCLTSLTQSLSENSVRLVKEMHRLQVNSLDFDIRPISTVQMVVCTNDILLADRVVNKGGIVLTFRQFQQLKQIS